MGRWYPKRVNKSTWCTYSYCFKWRGLGAEGRANPKKQNNFCHLTCTSFRQHQRSLLRDAHNFTTDCIIFDHISLLHRLSSGRITTKNEQQNLNIFLRNIIISFIVIKHTGSFCYAVKSSNIHVRVSSGSLRGHNSVWKNGALPSNGHFRGSCFAIGQHSASERWVFACVGWLVGWEDETLSLFRWSSAPFPALAVVQGKCLYGGWWQRSGRANGPAKSGGGRRGEARRTSDQEHIH